MVTELTVRRVDVTEPSKPGGLLAEPQRARSRH